MLQRLCMLWETPKGLWTAFRSKFPVAADKTGGNRASCYFDKSNVPKVAEFLGAKGKERTNREKAGISLFHHTHSCLKHMAAVHYAALLRLSLGYPAMSGRDTYLSLSLRLNHRARGWWQTKFGLLSFQHPRVHHPLGYRPKISHISVVMSFPLVWCCSDHSAAE